MDTAKEDIDNSTDLSIVRYHFTQNNEDYFYLLEQSPLQVLSLLPGDMGIHIHEIYSQSRRIENSVQNIKESKTIFDFLQKCFPLVDKGIFQFDNLNLTIDNFLQVTGHGDIEVNIVSKDSVAIRKLMSDILSENGYDSELIEQIVKRPEKYCILERPNRIIKECVTFEEVLEQWHD